MPLVATVAIPSSGMSPTMSMGWSLEARHRIAMVLRRMGERFADWRTLEPAIDAWASYGALGIASVAALALAAAQRF